jgi:hypothetical protein
MYLVRLWIFRMMILNRTIFRCDVVYPGVNLVAFRMILKVIYPILYAI